MEVDHDLRLLATHQALFWLHSADFQGARCMDAADEFRREVLEAPWPVLGAQLHSLASPAACEAAVAVRTSPHRAGVDCTQWFPEVALLLDKLSGGPHVIDGEACVLDEIGRSDFECLQKRARRRRWFAGCDPVTLCAFDLLYLDGRNVMGLPLERRKELLQELVAPLRDRLVFVGSLPAEADLFERAVMGARLEGFVAKRRDSPYVPGVRSRDWLKIKRPGWQEGRTWRN